MATTIATTDLVRSGALRRLAVALANRPVEMVLLGVAPVLWMTPAWTSFWLDEGLTYWVIKDGPREAIRRALDYQGHSPLYFLVAWAAMALGGASEFVLRVPSLIAVALTACALYSLGRRLVDAETGVTAAVVFAYWVYLVSNMSYNARPYALAVFAVTASTLALIRWLDAPTAANGVAYVVLSALVVYAQAIYAGILGIHVLAVLEFRRRRWTAATGLQFFALLASTVALTIPIVPQMMKFWRLHRVVYASPAAASTVLGILLWPAAAILLLFLVRRRLPARIPVFVYVWCVVPPFWLLILTTLSGDIGPSRYNYWLFPAFVLILAAALRAVRRRLRLAVLIAIALIAFTQANRGALEDWRQATALARPLIETSDTPVLVRSGLPEARLATWMGDAEHVEVVLAPLSFYPIPGQWRPLPYDMDEDYLRSAVLPVIASKPRVLLLAHDFQFERMRRLPLKQWFDQHLSEHRSRQIARLGNIVVVAYDLVAPVDK